MGFFPFIDNFFLAIPILSDLDGDVRIGVAVIFVPPFMGLEQLDENFFVHPRRGRAPHILFFIALKRSPFIVIHQDLHDLKRLFFESLDVEVDFGPNLMLGDKVFLGGVRVGIVLRAAVAAGNDHFFTGFFLYVVQKVDEDRVDAFFAVDDGKSVAGRPFAVADRIFGVVRIRERRMRRISFAAEKIACDPGGASLPRVGIPGRMGRRMDRGGIFVMVAVDRLAFAVAPPDLLILSMFDPKTAGCQKKEEA